MKLSLIVTTYNQPDYLERVLEGYRIQSDPPDEVIVADDGSGTDTARVVENAARASSFPVIHAWQEDRGFRAARARNLAIARSGGDYLVLTDGDCLPAVHFIRDHRRLARKGAFLQGHRILVNRDLSRTLRAGDLNTRNLALEALRGRLSNIHHLVPFPGISYATKKTRGIRTCNFALFKADVLAVNGFNEAFVGWGREDSEFAVRLTRRGLVRREAPFSATCFHLWHPEAPRDSLPRNQEILKSAAAGPAYCRAGIDRHLGADESGTDSQVMARSPGPAGGHQGADG